MSHKSEQYNAILLDALRTIVLRGFHDPRISGLITITSVKLSPDYKQATVMVSVLPDEKAELTVHGLQAAQRHIRHELGNMIEHRQPPVLSFKVDNAGKKEAAVLRALQKVAEERAKEAASGEQEAGSDDRGTGDQK
jgi:ribosome-binding factor A